MSRSDGSTASYYELPKGCSELQELISHRDMNAQIGEIFRACYRYGIADHSDRLRDAKKMRFYAEAEIKRLEKLQKAKDEEAVTEFFKDALAKTLEPAAQIDDESPRAQVIQQNGEMADEVYQAIDRVADDEWITVRTEPRHMEPGKTIRVKVQK